MVFFLIVKGFERFVRFVPLPKVQGLISIAELIGTPHIWKGYRGSSGT
jgi:hypothetical protein